MKLMGLVVVGLLLGAGVYAEDNEIVSFVKQCRGEHELKEVGLLACTCYIHGFVDGAQVERHVGKGPTPSMCLPEEGVTGETWIAIFLAQYGTLMSTNQEFAASVESGKMSRRIALAIAFRRQFPCN